MFIGAVPRQAVEQITRVVPFGTWREVFVGCSGSFRFDRAVKEVHPSVRVHSNDVSLLTCSLGALATDAEFPITFTGRLAFIEELLQGEPFAARVAAVEVALEMAKYKAANEYAQAHFAHYQTRFLDFLAPARARLTTFLDGLDIASSRRPCPWPLGIGGVKFYPGRLRTAPPPNFYDCELPEIAQGQDKRAD